VEFHSLYPSPKNIRVIESRRLRCVGQVTSMEESRSDLKILKGKPTDIGGKEM
jgi:hypothetical protein